MKTTISLLALMVALPASAASIRVLEPVTVTDHYSTVRRCCPSRYSALTGWGKHKRCGFRREAERGGAGGGGGWNLTGESGFMGGGHGLGNAVGSNNGAGLAGSVGLRTHTPRVVTEPIVPIPGPIAGKGFGSGAFLLACYIAIRLRRKNQW